MTNVEVNARMTSLVCDALLEGLLARASAAWACLGYVVGPANGWGERMEIV